MIQSGGWSGLRALDEHRKLARIAISFPPKLDDEFKINVAKMRVSLPAALRDIIAKAIGPAVTLAEDEYRQRERKSGGSAPSGSTPTPSPTAAPATSSSPIGEPTPEPLLEPALDGVSSAALTRTGDAPTASAPAASSAQVTMPELRRVGACLRSFVQGPAEEQVLEQLLSGAAASMEERRGRAHPRTRQSIADCPGAH